VHVGTLRFTEGAVITQPVLYTSDREVLVDGGTQITGELTRIPPHHPSVQDRIMLSLLWAIFRFAWAFVLGMFLLRVAPDLVLRTSEVVRRRPFPSLGWGFLGIFAIPILIAVLLITVVAIPLALVLLGGFLLALYASQIVLAMLVGRIIAPHEWRSMERLRHAVGVLACGLAVVVIVRSLPIPGWTFITSAAIAMVGIGALIMQILGRDRERPAEPSQVRA